MPRSKFRKNSGKPAPDPGDEDRKVSATCPSFFDAKNCVSFDQFLFLVSNVVDASSSVRITAKMDIIKVADYFDRPGTLLFIESG